MRIIITRPLPDGERTAALLRERGHDVLVMPLLLIEPVEADLSGTWSALVITSANATRAAAQQLTSLHWLPVFAVGDRTAEAARRAGFDDVVSSGGDAGHLLRLITARAGRNAAPLLYLAGEDRAADLAAELARRGLRVAMRVVYRAVALPLPAALADALKAGAIDAVMHYSRRSAETYLDGARSAGLLPQALSLRHLCLSPRVAEPLVAAGAAGIAVAAQPDEGAIAELAGRA